MPRRDYLNNVLDDLNALSLTLMATALMALYKSERYASLDHIEFLREITTPECTAKQNIRINNRLTKANLKRAPIQIRCFDYRDNRSGKCAVEYLHGYWEIVVSDSYSGYNKLTAVTRAGCWAHALRK